MADEPNGPTISIVIPTFNCAQYLGAAIRSCLAQEDLPDEVIVVDDGSTDNTAEILAGFAAVPRLKVLRQENRGISATRNAGIAAAQSCFVAFLDADDELLPWAVRRRRAALAACRDIDVMFTNYLISDMAGVNRGAHQSLDMSWLPDARLDLAPGEVIRLTRGFAKTYAAKEVPHEVVHTNCIIIRRRLFGETGGFDPEMVTSEDIDMWGRAFAKGRAALLSGVPDSIYFRWRGSAKKYEIVHTAEIAKLQLALTSAASRRERRRLRQEIAGCYLSLIYFLGVYRTPRAKLARLLARSILNHPILGGQARYLILLMLPRAIMRMLYRARQALQRGGIASVPNGGVVRQRRGAA